jgi:hypothetical protein
MTELQELIQEVTNQVIGNNAEKVYALLKADDDDTDNEEEIREVLWQQWMEETEDSVVYLSDEDIEECIAEFGIKKAYNLYYDQFSYKKNPPTIKEVLACIVWDSYNENDLIEAIKSDMSAWEKKWAEEQFVFKNLITQ